MSRRALAVTAFAFELTGWLLVATCFCVIPGIFWEKGFDRVVLLWICPASGVLGVSALLIAVRLRRQQMS